MNRLIKAKEKKCTKQEASRIVTSKKQARQLRARSKQEAYQSATCTTAPAPAPAGNHDAEESPQGSSSDGPTWHHRSLHITGQIARCEMLRSAVWRIWRSEVELVAAEACELGFSYLDGYTRDL